MIKRLLVLSTALLLHGSLLFAQQPAAPPAFTFWYDYTVKPGKEEEFLNLVKTVGGPVRDKLMAEGVVTAWGVEVPLLRHPDGATHTIWYSTNDWAGVAKVQAAMAEELAKPVAGVTAAKGARPMTNAERSLEVFDTTKTRDWLTRDIEAGYAKTMPGPGVLPISRYSFVKVHPGKGAEYRRLWDKYFKPVYEKLVADGVVLAWGLAVEDIKTEGEFTHYVWVATADMAAFDKVRAAFNADRDKRSQEERDGITASFNALLDADASRTLVTRSIVFKMPAPK